MSGAGGYIIAFAVLAAVYGLYTLFDRFTGAVGSKVEEKLDEALNRKMPIVDENQEDEK